MTARFATLHEMQTVYTVHDLMAMAELVETMLPDGDDGGADA
jgi:hypothetical protein